MLKISQLAKMWMEGDNLVKEGYTGTLCSQLI